VTQTPLADQADSPPALPVNWVGIAIPCIFYAVVCVVTVSILSDLGWGVSTALFMLVVGAGCLGGSGACYLTSGSA
jgi:hypothetical protein